LALVLGLTGRWQEAVQHYQRALALAPHITQIAFNYITQTLTHEGPNSAKSRVSALLQLQPDSGLLQLALANIFKREGNFPRALNHYRIARDKRAPPHELEPAYALTLDSSGASLEECIDAYRVALSVVQKDNTNLGQLKYRLGVLLLLAGQLAEARALIREAGDAGIAIGNSMKVIRTRGWLLLVKATMSAIRRKIAGRLT
jgi:tetratricopeptide (TPR) repeat protein